MFSITPMRGESMCQDTDMQERKGGGSGILHSREKEGAYTLCNSMAGTGEHYVK